MIEHIFTEFSSTLNGIILTILGLDTLRSIIAMLGIVKRETPFLGRLIYGKYDIIILKEVLRELGYGKHQAENMETRMKNIVKEEKYPDTDTALRLLYILSKYIIQFENTISYGMISEEKKLSYSNYYINTMEAVHNSSDLKDLSHIMIRIMKYNNEQRINFVIVPKGGNPLLAQEIASELGAHLIIAKDINDSARPQESDEIGRIGKIKYEGLGTLLEGQYEGKVKGVIVDCNTSGGTQLVTIASDFNDMINKCDLPIEDIHNCYVLFKLIKIDHKNKKEIDIDKRFADINCELHRLFDLDEDDKRALCNISYKDYYDAYASEDLHQLRKKIRNKSRYYYNDNKI